VQFQSDYFKYFGAIFVHKQTDLLQIIRKETNEIGKVLAVIIREPDEVDQMDTD